MNLSEIKEQIKKLSYEDTYKLYKAMSGFLTSKKLTKKQRSERGIAMNKARWGKVLSNTARNGDISK